jgi:hypothetical protein
VPGTGRRGEQAIFGLLIGHAEIVGSDAGASFTYPDIRPHAVAESLEELRDLASGAAIRPQPRASWAPCRADSTADAAWVHVASMRNLAPAYATRTFKAWRSELWSPEHQGRDRGCPLRAY